MTNTYITPLEYLRGNSGQETASLVGNVLRLSSALTAGATTLSVTPVTTVAQAAGTATGSALDFLSLALNQTVECVTPGTFLYIPSATAGGIAAYCNTTAAGKWGMTVKWVEF